VSGIDLGIISLFDEMVEELTKRPFDRKFGHNRIDGPWKACLLESID
jgi:hypothetical protein